MEIWEHEVSEQDKTIARVVLAGWRIERFYVGGIETPDDQPYYRVVGPSGQIMGHGEGASRLWLFKTRYTAALAAEQVMLEEGVLLPRTLEA
jgi:hypothetical protein